MFPGQCGNTAFFFKSQPDQFHFEFRGIVFPGKSFFSAHEVSTCKISGCLSYRILDSGPDGTQTTLTKQLAGYTDYSQVENPLRLLTKRRDSPIDRVDDIWSLRSSVDAFVHLGYLLGEEHLERFEKAVREVFSYIPEPPKAEDLFVPDNGIKTSYSSWLRNGMTTVLLHMAILILPT
ncbi:hypothetical protein ACQ64I_004612 [Escherichia coli]